MFESFWGKDPFDDPFFSNPFAGESGSMKEITIEEVDNDGDDTQKNSPPSKEVAAAKTPYGNSNEFQSLSYQRVAYGGINGIYYSSSVGRRTGGDGVVLLEIKEEDKTAGQALHTISRGIHEKGHTLTKKRNPDGQEDSLQILHNLEEDELTGFEENWKANADKHIPGWNGGFKSLEDTGLHTYLGWNGQGIWDGLALPWTDFWGSGGAIVPAAEPSAGSSSTGRVKNVVPVKIE